MTGSGSLACGLGSSRASPAVRRNYFKHIVDLAVAHAEIAEVRPWCRTKPVGSAPQRWVSRPAPGGATTAKTPGSLQPDDIVSMTVNSRPHPDQQDFAHHF